MAASSLSHENTRVAIYARVSTTNHGQDVSLQTRELEQFATARGWHLVDSYLDIGISVAAKTNARSLIASWPTPTSGASMW